MSLTTSDTEYLSVTKAATLLRTTPAAVQDMVEHNEIDSVVLIPAASVRALIAGGVK